MRIFRDNKQERHYIERIIKTYRCDFCGQDLNETDYGAYVEYTLHYGSADPCMGSSGDEYEFMKKHDIDVYSYLHEPYSFCPSPEYDCEQKFLLWMAKRVKQGKADENVTLDGCLREIRIKTTSKLIEDGVIKPEDLTGDQ